MLFYNFLQQKKDTCKTKAIVSTRTPPDFEQMSFNDIGVGFSIKNAL